MTLEYEIDAQKAEDIQVEDMLEHNDFMNTMNYLVDEGFIDLEEDADGNIRAYPITG